MADATPFFNPDLRCDAFFHAFDVADNADHLAAGVERIEGIEGDFQSVAIQRAKAFIEEKRIDGGLVADQIGERKGQRQADQKALATGQRARVAGDFALPAVDDVEFQFAGRFAAQQVAAVQLGQMTIGEQEQVVERQALGELAELVTLGRTDQAVEALPYLGFSRLRGDLGEKRLLVLTSLFVTGEQCTLGAELFAQAATLAVQRG